MATKRGKAERSGDLTNGEVNEQNTGSCGSTESGDYSARTLLEPSVFEQTNDWQHEPYDRDVSAGNERLPKCSNDFEQAESTGNPGCETCDRDDEQRVYPKDKSDDDDGDPDEGEHERLKTIALSNNSP